ncbi:MAG: nitroreductase/quinone reductase family protein [Actinomycetota bacterium]|nr:nitroreductase/quinone reductase family protein [Actinomycetota bacterium]
MSSTEPDLDLHSVIDLTTVGRLTGRLHRIEIWFAQHNGSLYLLSGGRDRSDWVRNLVADPIVTVRAGGTDHNGRGRIIDDPTEERLARDTVFAKYASRYGGDLTDWRESALPIAIDLWRDSSCGSQARRVGV